MENLPKQFQQYYTDVNVIILQLMLTYRALKIGNIRMSGLFNTLLPYPPLQTELIGDYGECVCCIMRPIESKSELFFFKYVMTNTTGLVILYIICFNIKRLFSLTL